MLLKEKRIFIIEDDLITRSIMQMILEQEGATIAFERWGLDTEKRLNDFMPVDVILLDLMFPGNVTGYDIFDRIRLVPEFSQIPVVAVSALDAMKKTRVKGFSGYIRKPIDMGAFARQIADIIDGKNVWNSG